MSQSLANKLSLTTNNYIQIYERNLMRKLVSHPISFNRDRALAIYSFVFTLITESVKQI